jgi:outer membrane protease
MDLLIRIGYNYDKLSTKYNCHFTVPVARIILIIRGSDPLQVFSLTCFVHDHDWKTSFSNDDETLCSDNEAVDTNHYSRLSVSLHTTRGLI